MFQIIHSLFNDFCSSQLSELKKHTKAVHPLKQGQKRPLDTPKRMIERRKREEREMERERKKGRRRDIEREGEIEREREREVKGIKR